MQLLGLEIIEMVTSTFELFELRKPLAFATSLFFCLFGEEKQLHI